MFQFEIRVRVDSEASEAFRRYVREMFLLGGNAGFQLADVQEAAQSQIEFESALFDEILVLLEKHGPLVWLLRSEWVI